MTEPYEKMNRRQLLKTTGARAVGAALAAIGLGSTIKGAEPDNGPDDLDMYDFLMPRVKFTHEKREVDRWNVRPGGDANLLRELSSVIRCKVKPIRQAYDWQPQWSASACRAGSVRNGVHDDIDPHLNCLLVFGPAKYAAATVAPATVKIRRA